jgi:hypothetical protein
VPKLRGWKLRVYFSQIRRHSTDRQSNASQRLAGKLLPSKLLKKKPPEKVPAATKDLEVRRATAVR